MNGVRSTFMRRGYLLTALAALLLLAASAGTASAQSVGWNMTSGTAHEGATAAATTPAQLVVKILRSGSPPDTDRDGSISDDEANAYYGNITVQGTGAEDGITIASRTGSGNVTDGQDNAPVTFINNEATLVISGDADTNWTDEELTLKLESSNSKVTPSPATLKINVMDSHVQPVARFTKSSISLTEDSQTTVSVRIGAETATAASIPGALAAISSGTLRVKITPANALYDMTTNPNGPLEIMVGTTPLAASGAPNPAGTYNVADLSTIITATTDGARLTGGTALTVVARPDMGGFADPMVEIAFDAASLKTDGGDIMSGGALTIDVQSDEEVPTLSFSPTDVTINEGESVETVLIAEGKHGDEVMKVKLMVEGDADVSLMHGDKMLEEMDGHVYVDLGDSNAARLTAMSHESRELADGDMAYKAWKLVEGSTDGANIGEGSWFKVDVVGSTAVPALPLIGQLLLALFLMAGGSRLYRRRQE